MVFQVHRLPCTTTLALSVAQGADVVILLVNLTGSPLRVVFALSIAPLSDSRSSCGACNKSLGFFSFALSV